jgi:vesicle coat complex subunit
MQSASTTQVCIAIVVRQGMKCYVPHPKCLHVTTIAPNPPTPWPVVDELLEQFLETFPDEAAAVQLQLVTATVKLFLKKPTDKPQQLIQLVLTFATQETDNPDLRDRAYIYWRLLSTDPG